jgi:hypothetical protein
MPVPSPFTAFLLSLSAWLGTTFDEAPGRRLLGQGPVVQRLTVRDEIVIHVPIAQHRDAPFKWVERKGPKCLPAGMIAGAAMVSPSAIDFVMRDRRRVRARLDSECAGLDFYGGFYVEPRDQAVCARREEIRSRAGSTCRIERFRSLHAKFKH